MAGACLAIKERQSHLDRTDALTFAHWLKTTCAAIRMDGFLHHRRHRTDVERRLRRLTMDAAQVPGLAAKAVRAAAGKTAYWMDDYPAAGYPAESRPV